MRRFFGTIIFILFVPLIYAFVIEAFKFLSANIAALLVNWMTYGLILYLLLYVFFLHSKIGFFEIFEHEVGHMVVALLFFRTVDMFAVSARQGGFVRCHDCSNVLITLAPYFLPVFTIPLLILKPFVTVTVHQTVDFFLGLTLAFHFAALFKEFRSWQPDIIRTGLRYALAVVIFLNAIFTVLTFSFALKNYAYTMDYLKQALLTALHTYQAIGGFVSRLFIFLQQIASSR